MTAGEFGTWTPIGAVQVAAAATTSPGTTRRRPLHGVEHRQQRQLHRPISIGESRATAPRWRTSRPSSIRTSTATAPSVSSTDHSGRRNEQRTYDGKLISSLPAASSVAARQLPFRQRRNRPDAHTWRHQNSTIGACRTRRIRQLRRSRMHDPSCHSTTFATPTSRRSFRMDSDHDSCWQLNAPACIGSASHTIRSLKARSDTNSTSADTHCRGGSILLLPRDLFVSAELSAWLEQSPYRRALITFNASTGI